MHLWQCGLGLQEGSLYLLSLAVASIVHCQLVLAVPGLSCQSPLPERSVGASMPVWIGLTQGLIAFAIAIAGSYQLTAGSCQPVVGSVWPRPGARSKSNRSRLEI